MKTIKVLSSNNIKSNRLKNMMDAALMNENYSIINEQSNTIDLINSLIVFVVEIDCIGSSAFLHDILLKCYKENENAFEGSLGCILVASPNELYTKDITQHIIFTANQMGCAFIGHPMVESLPNYINFKTWQKAINKPLKNICMDKSKQLIDRLKSYKEPVKKTKKAIMLHASNPKTSNTLMLWRKVKEQLNIKVDEFHVESGTVVDCKGCNFKTCIHYANEHSCFYGGQMVKEILPAIESADIIFWCCPNYNDALSANLTAVINRLTGLYRIMKFYDKTIYSIIVSGNSGNDSIAKQLIGALNINKGFYLPPHFALMALANDPLTIGDYPGINTKVKEFSRGVQKTI